MRPTRRLLLALVAWGLVACGAGQVVDDQAPPPEAPEGVGLTTSPPLLEPGLAEVRCGGPNGLEVEYNAPGYERMNESLGKKGPVFRWVLSDLGGKGTCYLLGIPDRSGDPHKAKFVLRSTKTFELVNGQCVCRNVRTPVQEGVFKPKK